VALMDKVVRFAWVFAVLATLSLITAGSYWFVVRELDNTWTGFMVAAGVLYAVYAFVDRDRVVAGASSRTFKYESGSFLLVVLVGAIAIGGYALSVRHDQKWDLTREKRFTLSEHTVQVLAGLNEDVKITAFFRDGSPAGTTFRDLAERYEMASPHIQVERIDPLRDPVKAEQFMITSEFGTVILERGDDRQRLESDMDEEHVTNAIVKLLSGEDHVVCWSEGHEELNPDDDSGATGLGFAVLKLEDQNFTVKNVRIFPDGIGKDCQALVIASPGRDFLPHEREAVAAYVAGGGRLLVLVEPDIVYEHALAPEFAADLERYGVDVGEDLVLEADPTNLMVRDDPSTFVLFDDAFDFHPIVKDLSSFVTLRTARSVAPREAVEGLTVTALMRTSDTSWGETHLDAADGVLKPDPGQDEVGDVPVAVAVVVTDPAVLGVAAPTGAPPPEAPTDLLDTDAGESGGVKLPAGAGTIAAPEAGSGVPADFVGKEGGRVVVIGDADFATNQLVTLGNNQDLFLNAVSWLVEADDQLGERSDEERSEKLELTVIHEALLWLTSIFLVPGGAAAVALVVLVRRRFL
jgi:hypothetical protein